MLRACRIRRRDARARIACADKHPHAPLRQLAHRTKSERDETDAVERLVDDIWKIVRAARRWLRVRATAFRGGSRDSGPRHAQRGLYRDGTRFALRVRRGHGRSATVARKFSD